MNQDKELKQLEEIIQMIEARDNVQEKIELYKHLEHGFKDSIRVLITYLPMHIDDPIRMNIILQRISTQVHTVLGITHKIKALEE